MDLDTHQKLSDIGVASIEVLAVMDPYSSQYWYVREHIARNALSVLGMDQFVSGDYVEKCIEDKRRLSSGVKKLDKNLSGGIEEGSVVGFYGSHQYSNNLWCAQLAVMCTRPVEKGGLDKSVLWICTEATFNPISLRAIARRFRASPDKTLQRVSVLQVSSYRQLLDDLPLILDKCLTEYGMVVLDSVLSLFKIGPEREPEDLSGWSAQEINWFYENQDEIATGQYNDLKFFMDTVRRFAKTNGTIFIFTNRQYFGHLVVYREFLNDPHIVDHVTDYRFYNKMFREGMHKLSLVDNAELPEFTVEVYKGIGGYHRTKVNRQTVEKRISGPTEVEWENYREGGIL